jgi:hypothetical protein
MSYFDDASLVFIPSGTKVSKAYSVKPIDGTGDLTFTRSNDTATRVASNGLIERVRTNLALYSEQFDNAYWTKSQATITANATTAPDGTLTAEKFIEGSGSVAPECARTPISTSNSIFTLSVFAKASERNFLIINNNDGTGSFRVWFNLTTGVIGTTDAGVTAFIENVGNGWFRCGVARQITVFASATSAFQIGSADGVDTYTGDGTSGIFIWGAQMELSDFGPTDYIATTSAAVSVGPVANVPRLDYLNSSCPRLLLEPQRQNVLNFSESFDNAYWNKAGTTITANNTTSPDGYTNADRLTSSGAGGDEYIQRAGLSTTAGTYTSSIFVKNVNATQTVLMAVHLGEGSVTSDLRYTWSTGAVITNGTNAVSGKATSYGNGWVRLEFTYTIGASVSGHWFRTYVQTGVSTNSIFIYGASVELGAYATSYIPTLGAAVTRGTEQYDKVITSLVPDATTFTWEVDFIVPEVAGGGGEIFGRNAAGTIQLRIYANNGGVIRFRVESGAQNYDTAVSVGDTAKCIFRCSSGVVSAFYNGVKIHTFTGVSMDFGKIQFGPPVTSPKIIRSLVFPTALTDAQCIELTA